MTQGPEELSSIAAAAARAGGATIRAAAAGPMAAPQIKAAGDYVTEVDRASESAIAGQLAEATPGVPIVAEESAESRAERPRTATGWWIPSTVRRTSSTASRWSACPVAFIRNGAPVAGAVHAPFLGDTYVAARGAGASHERADGSRKAIRVSNRPPDRAIVGTGFPFRRKDLLERYLTTMNAALARFEDLRRPGAAALDLAWVAAGVFDGFFELALSPWDVAAGGLLIAEAGGVVTDWSGGPGLPLGRRPRRIGGGARFAPASSRRLAGPEEAAKA